MLVSLDFERELHQRSGSENIRLSGASDVNLTPSSLRETTTGHCDAVKNRTSVFCSSFTAKRVYAIDHCRIPYDNCIFTCSHCSLDIFIRSYRIMLCVYVKINHPLWGGGLYITSLLNPFVTIMTKYIETKLINPTYTNLTQPIHFGRVRLCIS